jgi:transcription initiation factor TFIIB
VTDDVHLERGRNKKARIEGDRRSGAAMTRLMHDGGLATKIGRNVDGSGRALDGATRRKLKRLRRWHGRAKFDSKRERNVARANAEIRRIAGALDVAETVAEQAAAVYRQAAEADLLFGRSVEGMATASIYAAARIAGRPDRLEDFAAVARVSRSRVLACYKALNRGLGLPVPPRTAPELVGRLAGEIGVGQDVRRRAEASAKTWEDEHGGGKARYAAAAAALYLASPDVTQRECGDAADVSANTIRARLEEMEGDA